MRRDSSIEEKFLNRGSCEILPERSAAVGGFPTSGPERNDTHLYFWEHVSSGTAFIPLQTRVSNSFVNTLLSRRSSSRFSKTRIPQFLSTQRVSREYSAEARLLHQLLWRSRMVNQLRRSTNRKVFWTIGAHSGGLLRDKPLGITNTATASLIVIGDRLCRMRSSQQIAHPSFGDLRLTNEGTSKKFLVTLPRDPVDLDSVL